MEKRVFFRSRSLPYLLVAPQLAITLVFFIWPASQALYQSLLIQDPFGLSTEFVWLDNFEHLVSDPLYIGAFWTTAKFSLLVTALSLGLALQSSRSGHVARSSRRLRCPNPIPCGQSRCPVSGRRSSDPQCSTRSRSRSPR